MPSLTIKNIPEPLFVRLKATAARNHRSMNSEAIHLMERCLLPQKVSTREFIAEIRQFHEELGPLEFSLEEIDRAKREGRP